MKNFKFLKIISFFTMIFISKIGFAFEIDSTRFDQRIDTGGYKEFKIKNNGTKPVRYKINIVNPAKGKESMAQWIKIYPKVLNISPLDEKTLKVYGQSPSNVEIGEYFCDLIFTPLIVPTLKKDENTDKISGVSSISFVPQIELMGYVGDPQFDKNIDLKDFIFEDTHKGVRLTGILENLSHVSTSIGITLISSNMYSLGGGVLGRINKNNSQKFTVLFEDIKQKSLIKEIHLYDAVKLTTIKKIKL